MLTYKQIILCVGMLVTGSINTLSKKSQNDCSAPGIPDPKFNGTAVEHKFDHPWFQTLVMFIGEMLCLFGLIYSRYKERKEISGRDQNRLMVSPGSSGEFAAQVLTDSYPRIFQWIFMIPMIFDLLGTSLAGIGLLYVNASVWQMLRGSIILFTGLLSKIFLKRKLRNLQWLGMFFAVIGLCLVGLSSILHKSNSINSKAALGILFILAGQLVSASQMIVEEIFLKSKSYQPLQIVGMEGTYGFICMALIVLPAMYFIPGSQIGDRYENSLDALYQIKNDYRLLIFNLLYLISIAFYNYFGLAVTKSLTAIHRTLMDACRTLFVWLCSLLIYYSFSKDFGESFDKTYGIFQIDGFLFLMIGTAFYNEIMDVPCIPALRKVQAETYPSLVDSDVNPASPSIQDSLTVNERTPLLHHDYDSLS